MDLSKSTMFPQPTDFLQRRRSHVNDGHSLLDIFAAARLMLSSKFLNIHTSDSSEYPQLVLPSLLRLLYSNPATCAKWLSQSQPNPTSTPTDCLFPSGFSHTRDSFCILTIHPVNLAWYILPPNLFVCHQTLPASPLIQISNLNSKSQLTSIPTYKRVLATLPGSYSSILGPPRHDFSTHPVIAQHRLTVLRTPKTSLACLFYSFNASVLFLVPNSF